MKFCTKCGKKLNTQSKFCTHCGEQVENTESEAITPKSIPDKVESSYDSSSTKRKIDEINHRIALQNNQTSIINRAWYAAAFFLLIIILAFMDFDILPIHPGIVMLSIFFLISSLVVGYMFQSRKEKLQSLISGEDLLAEWKLSPAQIKEYANYIFKQESGKNIVILFSIGVIAIVVFGIFILVINEGKLAMFLVLIGLIAFLSLFAFGMPFYYKMKNAKGDGHILIGAKYAYVNGYFHNWDFQLSGLSKVKKIKEPFYGIQLVYYYTDRTLEHSEELILPVNKEVDIQGLITV